MTLTDVAVNSDFVQGLDGCIISGDILAGKINIMLSEHSLVRTFDDWMSSILYQLIQKQVKISHNCSFRSIRMLENVHQRLADILRCLNCSIFGMINNICFGKSAGPKKMWSGGTAENNPDIVPGIVQICIINWCEALSKILLRLSLHERLVHRKADQASEQKIPVRHVP